MISRYKYTVDATKRLDDFVFKSIMIYTCIPSTSKNINENVVYYARQNIGSVFQQ